MPILFLDIIVLSISGFIGKGTLVKAGGWMLPLTLGVMISGNGFKLPAITWGIIYWALALFVGHVVAVVREIIAEGGYKSTVNKDNSDYDGTGNP